MNRRSFMAALGLLPLVPVAVQTAETNDGQRHYILDSDADFEISGEGWVCGGDIEVVAMSSLGRPVWQFTSELAKA